MPTLKIIKAWKDVEYRDALSEEQRSRLPGHPAGSIELQPSEIDDSPFGPVRVAAGTFTGPCKCVSTYHHC